MSQPAAPKLTKRQKASVSLVERSKTYAAIDAMKLMKQAATAKFDESVDVAVNLGIDAKKSDQTVRGAVVLPAGTGKKVRVAVFAQGDKAAAAKAAGADIVGMEDLAEQIKGGKMDFDVLIASPDTMRIVGQLGQILGPRGLMPNPKTGTVTTDIAKAVQEVKAGKVEFRTDKGALVHVPVGKLSFSADKLVENATVVITSVLKAKPSVAKGKYMKGVYLSSTMGPGVPLDITAIETAARGA